MSNTPSFKNILDKYLEGKASPEQQQLIEVWFEAIGEEEVRLITLSDREKEALFESLRQTQRFGKVRRRKYFLLQPSWKAVAIWSGLLLGGWGMLQMVRTGRKSGAQQLAFVQVSTGRAEIRKVRLPDSSELWLNANTTLRYAADFFTHRQVLLNGEALFDVTHRPDHPFVIETPDGLKTEVLGTRFDIKSYDQLPVSEIAVINGKIRVSHTNSLLGIFTRGQAIAWYRRDDSARQSVLAHPESLSGWITGDWEFDNKGINDLALLLRNQFGISLICSRPDLLSARITVNFNSRQSAREIIELFCAFTEGRSRWKDSSTVELY